MLLIGCTPPERNTEQHDVFFGIGETINELVPAVQAFWPGIIKIHFDAWREVRCVSGCRVDIVAKENSPGSGDGGLELAANASVPGPTTSDSFKLFFLNLGGYKPGEFEEFHYKMLVAAKDKTEAIAMAKETAFFRHTGFTGAHSHIDDKYGVDVDDVYEISDILAKEMKEKYSIIVTEDSSLPEDEIHLGYFKLSMFQ
jgi:hypothetical protein